MSKVLKDQVAVVTGGSGGIGRDICLKLAGLGARVFVNYSSRPDAADETVKKCEELGAKAEAIGFDVADSSAVNEAIKQIMEKAGRIDILVNNAGITQNGLFVRLKDEEWNSVIGVNLNGAFYCSRAVSRPMMKQRQGRIINISSVVAEMGNAGQAPYVASKAGLIGFTKSLAKELGQRAITVNAVTPGFIETEMTASLDEKLQEEYRKIIPLGRFGSAAEVADLVAFLAGPDSSYITGQVIGINGGMYM